MMVTLECLDWKQLRKLLASRPDDTQHFNHSQVGFKIFQALVVLLFWH